VGAANEGGKAGDYERKLKNAGKRRIEFNQLPSISYRSEMSWVMPRNTHGSISEKMTLTSKVRGLGIKNE
jgi:hypothetical protein